MEHSSVDGLEATGRVGAASVEVLELLIWFEMDAKLEILAVPV